MWLAKTEENKCFKFWVNCKRRPTTKVISTVKKLLYTKFEGNTATKWGISQEETTNCKYLEAMRKSSPDITTNQSGLVTNLANPWLAASPDKLAKKS